MNHEPPDPVLALCDDILSDIHEMSAQVTALVSKYHTARLDIASKAKDSTPAKRARYVSPLGDRRERAVQCWNCGHSTWALDSLCGPCFEALPDGAA